MLTDRSVDAPLMPSNMPKTCIEPYCRAKILDRLASLGRNAGRYRPKSGGIW